jgi:3-methyl-2-oxobutanoate hydroxymethyltransferase
MGIKNQKIDLFCKSKKKLVCLTAYTTYMAEIIDKYCDLVLVGDSLSMVLYGDKNTSHLSLSTMIRHGKAVQKGIQKSVLVVDMPKNTYEKSPEIALKNARKIMIETKCDAVKMEGGVTIAKTIKKLVNNNIPVMGHIGLLPQQITKSSDYRIKGKSKIEEKIVINDLLAVQKNGAFSVVIEGVTEKLAIKLCKIAKIKTIGIGATKKCDGQVLVTEDMLGIFEKTAKFVKKYNNLKKIISNSVKKYSSDIINLKFPTKNNIY